MKVLCCASVDTANFVPSSPILVTVMVEEISSSETSVLTRATRRNFPKCGIIHRVMSVQMLMGPHLEEKSTILGPFLQILYFNAENVS
jgi:hypothetical protein